MAQMQLFYEDVQVDEEIRPLYQYTDDEMLLNWAVVSNNFDPGHFDVFHSHVRGNEPSITGQLKLALMEKVIMEWAGPKTWVKKISAQYRVWDNFFEIKAFRGKIVNKREEGNLKLVDLELSMARSDGRVTTTGTASVVLPSRS